MLTPVDHIDRFRSACTTSAKVDRAVQAQVISLFVGLIVIVPMMGVDALHGNLSEVAFKIVNLLTTHLFSLFFMAAFAHCADGHGAIFDAVVCVLVVVASNYWTELTGTAGIRFLWAMPLAFWAQVTSGCLASLLPVWYEQSPQR